MSSSVDSEPFGVYNMGVNRPLHELIQDRQREILREIEKSQRDQMRLVIRTGGGGGSGITSTVKRTVRKTRQIKPTKPWPRSAEQESQLMALLNKPSIWSGFWSKLDKTLRGTLSAFKTNVWPNYREIWQATSNTPKT